MEAQSQSGAGLLAQWRRWPLYGRILGALMIGILLGVGLGPRAAAFDLPAKIILQLLGALAPPLILIAVTHVLMTTEIAGKTALRLGSLLILNTVVAICIGLFVANVVKPGHWSQHAPPEKPEKVESKSPDKFDLVSKNQVGDSAFASPAICGGQVFLRVATGDGPDRREWLYCFGK